MAHFIFIAHYYNQNNKDNDKKLRNSITLLCMIMPNGTDNNDCDVIATMNATSWVMHYRTISVDMESAGPLLLFIVGIYCFAVLLFNACCGTALYACCGTALYACCGTALCACCGTALCQC